MAKNSESIDERMERKRLEFEQRKSESKKRMDEHRQSVESGQTMGELSIKVDIDVSEALKGLKAIQREAKKTARALREVEGMSPKDAILRFTDDEIFEVLSSRGWDIETVVLSDEFKNPNMSSVNMYKNHKEN